MRNIGAEWRNLAEGFRRVEALEAQFRAEWEPRLEQARKQKEEALSLLLLYLPAPSFDLFLAVAVPAMLAFYGPATPAYIRRFLFPCLHTVVPYCVPGGVRRWWVTRRGVLCAR